MRETERERERERERSFFTFHIAPHACICRWLTCVYSTRQGATAERLREAQSINKSLSALGDVISALSSGEKFIPYRNNKLTLLMSDSLGGAPEALL